MGRSRKAIDNVTAKTLAKKKRRKDTGKGNKKHGRHKDHCQRYRMLNRREKNKARKMKKHLKMVEKKKRLI